ncbi:MAG: hypoxanthine phosphoribosyltransferase [Bacteroidales bacterium]|nr:hypoxanthine phosphoribosyltransferase [Bacteroidales bacterium]
METVSIHDKKFRLYIPSEDIDQKVSDLALQLSKDLKGKELVFLVVLNGAFMFASDLMKKLKLPARVSFVKLASYEGSQSSGQVRELIGINEILKDKTVVLVEDIIDSGNTLDELLQALKPHEPKEIRVVSLLFKPDAYEQSFRIDYTGFRIPNDFVVGYGLDYDGFGRNLKDIFTVVEF